MHSRSEEPFRLNAVAAALVAAGFGSIAAGAYAPAAHAQNGERPSAARDDDRLETVVVTDRTPDTAASAKFTAPLLDLPQTYTVIPQELFNAQGAVSLTDVLRNTPGISFSGGENAFSTSSNNFSLRGFDTSGNIFIDGVRDSGNYARDVFNLERVEVAKGAAADNGRGGAGGYVNLVTKSPQLESFAQGMTSYGFDRYDSDGRARVAFDVNRALTDTAAVRVNVMRQDGGVAGREHAENDAWGVAPSLAFGLGTDTRFVASLQHLDQSSRPDWGVPAAMIDGMMRYDPVAAAADRDNFYGLASDYDDNESTTFLARVEHDFASGVSFLNQTRWTDTERDAVYTVPSGYDAATQQVTASRQAFLRETGTLSNLTNFSLSIDGGAVRHTIAAGIELTKEESEAGRFPTDSPAATDVFAPDPFRSPAWRPDPAQSAKVEIDTAALYFYDTMEFSERWELTAGLRTERYEGRIDSRELATGDPQGPDGYEIDETTTSGKVGVVYKPARNGSVYASVGISSLPPGSYLSNPDISRTGDNAFPGLTGQNNINAKVQRAVNYELGTKWNLADGRLSTNVALFRTERRNVGISGKTPGDPASPTVLQGYGKQIVEGIELGASGSITEAWSIHGGLLLMDSERRHSEFLDAARREANPNDYGAVLRTSGDQLAFTPRRSATLWTTYSLPFGLTIGGGVQYVGDSYAGRPDDADRIIPNGTFGKLPSYTVMSLMASYEASERVLVRLNVENAADELYATIANWPAQRVTLGAPRSYLLSADFRF